jgi:uncharacterized protein (TIGR02996 family)
MMDRPWSRRELVAALEESDEQERTADCRAALLECCDEEPHRRRPMTDEAFLQAITAAPHDDAPRLVYADWLDEHGSPAGAARAEFIRAQVALARLPAAEPRRAELHRRSLELLDEHRDTWRASLPRLQGVSWHRFWRGFVSGADVQAWKFYRRHAAALFGAAPVQFLRVFGISASTCGELAASPYLARLTSLELVGAWIGDEGAAALAASPHLAALRSLIARGPLRTCFGPRPRRTLIGDTGALALAGSPHLGRLELLDLRDNAVEPEARLALTRRFGGAVRA